MNSNPKKRLRTEAQLARKRHADKVNHKAKRDRTKSQMDKLEAEMVQLRQRMKEISDQLTVLHADVLRGQNAYTPPTVKDQASPAPTIPLTPDPCSGQASHSPFSPPQAHNSLVGIPDLSPGYSFESLSAHFQRYSPSTTPAIASASLSINHDAPASAATATAATPFAPPTPQQAQSPPHSSIPSRATDDDNGIESLLDILSEHQNRILVDCRCGVEHKSPTECLEYSTFLILLRTHEKLSRSIYNTPPRLPRNPSLLSLFRHSCSNNPIIHILGSIFNRIHPVNVYTLFGIFLGMYRFLRWRLCPHNESRGDIPPWLRPTEIQKSIPHPVSIDFLPWPGLRDYLTTHQNEDGRHSVNLYIRSVRFRWPEHKAFYRTTSRGDIALNAEFVAELNKYENWMLSAEWARMFPHLAQYVNVEEGPASTSRDSSVQTEG